MVQSGRLNKKIVLGKKVPKKDAQGFQTYEFVPIANPWASVKPTTEQSEINTDQESVLRERVQFEIYYREGVTTNMYISFRGKEYEITGIFNPGFEDKYLTLTGERDQSRGES